MRVNALCLCLDASAACPFQRLPERSSVVFEAAIKKVLKTAADRREQACRKEYNKGTFGKVHPNVLDEARAQGRWH